MDVKLYDVLMHSVIVVLNMKTGTIKEENHSISVFTLISLKH